MRLIINGAGIGIRKPSGTFISYSFYNWNIAHVEEEKRIDYLRAKWQRMIKSLIHFSNDIAIIKNNACVFKKGNP
jgi:hypothetical protein